MPTKWPEPATRWRARGVWSSTSPRFRGAVTQQAIDAPASEAKFDTSLNEFAISNSEWYLCGRDTRQPCLMEPYLYEISPGNKMLMTSLTVLDMNLPIFQQQAETLGKSFYDNKADVTIVSKMGSPLKEVGLALPTGQQVSQSMTATLSSCSRVGSGDASNQLKWCLSIKAPIAFS